MAPGSFLMSSALCGSWWYIILRTGASSRDSSSGRASGRRGHRSTCRLWSLRRSCLSFLIDSTGVCVVELPKLAVWHMSLFCLSQARRLRQGSSTAGDTGTTCSRCGMPQPDAESRSASSGVNRRCCLTLTFCTSSSSRRAPCRWHMNLRLNVPV